MATFLCTLVGIVIQQTWNETRFHADGFTREAQFDAIEERLEAAQTFNREIQRNNELLESEVKRLRNLTGEIHRLRAQSGELLRVRNESQLLARGLSTLEAENDHLLEENRNLKENLTDETKRMFLDLLGRVASREELVQAVKHFEIRAPVEFHLLAPAVVVQADAE